MLLRAGISKDARTKVDKTPVHIAAQEGHSDVLELLLKNGSDVEAVDMVRFNISLCLNLYRRPTTSHSGLLTIIMVFDRST